MKHRGPISAVPNTPTATARRPEPLLPASTRVPSPNRELSKFFKALSDETRREILRLLERRSFTVGEIVSNFELSQPTISRHLSVLKEALLVEDQRQGQHVVYRLSDETLARSVNRFFGEFEQCQRILRRF